MLASGAQQSSRVLMSSGYTVRGTKGREGSREDERLRIGGLRGRAGLPRRQVRVRVTSCQIVDVGAGTKLLE